jgi:hypothetical protein
MLGPPRTKAPRHDPTPFATTTVNALPPLSLNTRSPQGQESASYAALVVSARVMSKDVRNPYAGWRVVWAVAAATPGLRLSAWRGIISLRSSRELLADRRSDDGALQGGGSFRARPRRLRRVLHRKAGRMCSFRDTYPQYGRSLSAAPPS